MDEGRRILLEDNAVPPTAPSDGARQSLAPLAKHEDPDAVPVDEVAEPSGMSPRARALTIGVGLGGGLLLLHTLVGLAGLLQRSPVLGIAWSAVFVLVAGAAGREVWRMWRELRSLRNRQDLRARAERLLAHNGVAEGLPFCEQLAREAGALQGAEYARCKGLVTATHNDREVLQLYARTVLTEADRRALERVSAHAGDVAVMVAVSYFPAIDMLLVLWRQLKLVEEVSAVYGLSPGYWGRIRLLRKVLRNMALAGAAEIATEVGVEMFGAGAAAKLSGALAQGVAAGVLTARLGLRTMDACRGIPWSAGERPRLRSVTGGVIERAKQYLGDAS